MIEDLILFWNSAKGPPPFACGGGTPLRELARGSGWFAEIYLILLTCPDIRAKTITFWDKAFEICHSSTGRVRFFGKVQFFWYKIHFFEKS